jgi:hypothetical protein
MIERKNLSPRTFLFAPLNVAGWENLFFNIIMPEVKTRFLLTLKMDKIIMPEVKTRFLLTLKMDKIIMPEVKTRFLQTLKMDKIIMPEVKTRFLLTRTDTQKCAYLKIRGGRISIPIHS